MFVLLQSFLSRTKMVLHQFARVEYIGVNCPDVEAGVSCVCLFVCCIFKFIRVILIVGLRIFTQNGAVIFRIPGLDSLDRK